MLQNKHLRHLDAMLVQFDAYTASLEKEGPSSLYEPIQYAMSTGGKRVRGTTYPLWR